MQGRAGDTKCEAAGALVADTRTAQPHLQVWGRLLAGSRPHGHRWDAPRACRLLHLVPQASPATAGPSALLLCPVWTAAAATAAGRGAPRVFIDLRRARGREQPGCPLQPGGARRATHSSTARCWARRAANLKCAGLLRLHTPMHLCTCPPPGPSLPRHLGRVYQELRQLAGLAPAQLLVPVTVQDEHALVDAHPLQPLAVLVPDRAVH